MLKWLDRFKKVVLVVITVMMAVVLLAAVVDLAVILVKNLYSPPILILDINELLGLFGLFLLVLIGIELFETMEIYIKENVIHVEVVIAVALIAVSRKIIILDIKKLPSATLLAIAAIVLALSIGYYLIIKANKSGDKKD